MAGPAFLKYQAHFGGKARQAKTMEYFLQQLINGLTLGSIYGLIAIGYTMVYGIIGMINFAHGDIFMVGAFIALIAFLAARHDLGDAVLIPLALLIVLVVAMLLTSVWGWTVERIAYRPLRGSFRLAPLITAIGMSIILQNFVQIVQGARVKPLPPDRHRRLCAASRAQRLHRSARPTSRSSSSCTTARADDGASRCSSRAPRSAGRSAPASRTRGWPRCSASMSTARSR